MKPFLLAGALAIAAGLAASAQIGTPAVLPNPQPAYSQLASYLNLSAAQLQSLEQIQQQKNQAVQDIYKQVSDKQTQLTAQLNSPSPDPLTVGQLTLAIRALQQQVPAAAKPFRQPALAVLTPDQVMKLQGLITALQLQIPANQAVTLNLIDSPNTGVVPLLLPAPVFSPGISFGPAQIQSVQVQ